MVDTTRRWPVAVGAIVIQVCLGSIYAWSVFTTRLQDEGWSKVETQIVFSTGLATFAAVMVFAGRKLRTWDPQRLALLGGLTLGVGYAVAAIGGGASFVAVLVGRQRTLTRTRRCLDTHADARWAQSLGCCPRMFEARGTAHAL